MPLESSEAVLNNLRFSAREIEACEWAAPTFTRLGIDNSFVSSFRAEATLLDGCRNEKGLVAYLEATIHENTVIKTMENSILCNNAVYIWMLHTKKAYQHNGIASKMLESVEEYTASVFGIQPDMILLAPALHVINEEGKLTEATDPIEYLLGLRKLVPFYMKHGFVFDGAGMYKILNKTGVIGHEGKD